MKETTKELCVQILKDNQIIKAILVDLLAVLKRLEKNGK